MIFPCLCIYISIFRVSSVAVNFFSFRDCIFLWCLHRFPRILTCTLQIVCTVVRKRSSFFTVLQAFLLFGVQTCDIFLLILWFELHNFQSYVFVVTNLWTWFWAFRSLWIVFRSRCFGRLPQSWVCMRGLLFCSLVNLRFLI